MSDWQPIETAPKDGTSILVYPAWKTNGTVRCAEAQWKAAPRGSGWHAMGFTWIPMICTHWMPLPEPPK